MLPVGTTVELVANKSYGWQNCYKALANGERRFYKIVRTHQAYNDIWGGQRERYTCYYVHPVTGRRRGSWDYSLYADEVVPMLRGPVNLGDYM